MRADEEAFLGEKSGALPDRGLPDRVAEDDGRDRRPGRSDPLASPSDTTPCKPNQLDEPARLTLDPTRHVLEHGLTVLPLP